MSSVHDTEVAATDPADNPVLKAALNYAARGLPIFPVRPDKRPYTAHGFKDASTDPARITRWWTDSPAALIGVPTGVQTDLHVIDVDVHAHDGFHALKRLDFSREGVPCVATPSGGNHFYHRLGGLALKNTAGKLGPGIDTRGEGGYIIAPPSRPDPAKPGYQFISTDVDLLAAPIIPKELVERLKDTSKPTAKDALKLECERVAAANPGSRNHILNRAAFKLAKLVTAGKLEEKEVRESLTKAALEVGLEPYEIEKTLDSALAAGKRDAEVTEKRSERASKAQGRPLDLPDPEPWPEAVDGAELLDAMVYDLCSYVVMTAYQAYAVALWVMHTFAVDVFAITPRLAITSPLLGCGKTTLLDWIGTVVPRKVEACNISTAATFRTIEAAKPTLLIDEADTFLKDNPDLKGVLNSGHRRGGQVIRTVGDAHEPRVFVTFCSCAIALIGKLPPTLHSRSIEIALQRRRPDEAVRSFRLDRVTDKFARQCRRWVIDYKVELAKIDPELPEELVNRTADNWRPLFAIAEIIGGPWPERVIKAARQLTGRGVRLDSLAHQMLADVRSAFDASNVDRMSSESLITVLTADPEKPWQEFKRGKPITPRQLASLLKPFGITSKDVRIKREHGEEAVMKGYERAQFADAWNRYVPAEQPRILEEEL